MREEHEPREVPGQTHHPQGGFNGQDLLFDGEPGARNPFFLARSRPAIDSVLPPKFVEKCRQLLCRQISRLGGVA